VEEMLMTNGGDGDGGRYVGCSGGSGGPLSGDDTGGAWVCFAADAT